MAKIIPFPSKEADSERRRLAKEELKRKREKAIFFTNANPDQKGWHRKMFDLFYENHQDN